MICIRELSVSFDGRTVFSGFSADLPSNGTVLIMGASGIGKTTLLRVMAGLQVPHSGTVTGLEGRQIGMVFQEPRLLPDRTALQNAALAADVSQARALLLRLGLSDCLNEKAKHLSGGQQQRVSLARAFAYTHDVMLLDEPFSGLDADNRAAAADLIREAALSVVVTHDSTDADLLHADRILYL